MAKAKKIALIGTAPSSVRLAPYSDPSWEIWACSPGAAPIVPRANVWFELHHIHPSEEWWHNDYIARINSYKCPVYVIEPLPEILPQSVAYPKDVMLKEFGPWFFTSSLSWMMAMAIMEEPEEIALFGVDMSHQSEWEFQRSGCHFFISEARRRGIRVTLPLESDLGRPPALYGFQEHNHLYRKLRSRRVELTQKIRECEAAVQAKRDELFYYRGALEDLEYTIRTWVHDDLQIELSEWQPDGPDSSPTLPEPGELNVDASENLDVDVEEKPKRKTRGRKRAYVNGSAEEKTAEASG